MNRSVHRLELGTHEFVFFNDSVNPGRAEDLVSGVSEERIAEAAQAVGSPGEGEVRDTSAMLFKLGESWRLVDSGRGPEVGKLHQFLEAEGVDPAEIETVILTHADGDHTGGLVLGGSDLAFPNARVRMSRLAWEAWTDEVVLAGMSPDWAQQARAAAGAISERLALVEPGQEILPGVRALDAPGHRDGHIALEFDLGGERFVHLADTCLHLVFLRHPHWQCTYDSYPERAAGTRATLLADAAEKGHLVAATHLPFPGLGRLVKADVGYGWRPAG
jgi:glyoxylase-like metal-dependent hydrolase (beta-lactamase superfamily II)